MWQAVWVYHQVIGSSVMSDRRSTNFVKSTVFFYSARLLLLFRVLYTINFRILSFSVFLMVSLKKNTVTFILARYQHRPWRAILSTISYLKKTFPRCFSRRWTNKRLEQPKNSAPMIKEYQWIINVDPAPTHRSSSVFISGSDETQVGYSRLCPIRIHLK